MRTLLVALAAVASARLNEPTPARRLTDELDMAYLSEVAANGKLGAKVLFKLDAKHKLVEKNKAHKIAANVVDALPDVAARLAAYGDDAYRDEFFHFPLERAWIFHELDDEEAVRLRATWIDTSDDDVYRFIAPWGCMLVFDDGSTAPGGAGVRFEDTRGPG